jgi:molecular chaperone GrpE
MSDQHSSAFPSMPSDARPEEIEAAMHAHAGEALAQAQGELAALQAKSAELADQFLRAKAEAENARRRAEEDIS